MKGVLAVIVAAILAAPLAFSAAPAPSLQMTSAERGFFQLGDQVGQAAFAYASLAHQAEQIKLTRGKSGQIQQLASLAPVADESRAAARAGFKHALILLTTLHAPPKAVKPVQVALDRLDKPLVLRGDARAVSLFSAKAARTLGTLDEFDALSSLPENHALQQWLNSPAPGPSAHVWFAEGLIAALTQIAAANHMPELLPPVKELATDLRGLRDWLALRQPEAPTAAQIALDSAVDEFLADASRTGVLQTAPLTLPQLQSLGDISRRLQAQVSEAPAAPL